ncbi:transcription initiation factor TFIID TATA-box-binding protein [Babesia microti strain RI]|uniref:Transcription initiation factor TFIID TATA-box-binding protein n=1 Tax=Babesia microti (strain RI) TaxID=1133968 RepID=A0A1R4ABK8_BABMR|nr:transcription initiation factor TFIID TATA-box-binding protein [Babesia microti strain RI]SJK86324.1 transcription initiation factor TFIID TATA-box-binding protein [Babesia microti strain RI]|eukprot:XP_021338496.1 transcription initiation factor TFIID TATA-box-binding protein [Babesia microti strain RI]
MGDDFFCSTLNGLVNGDDIGKILDESAIDECDDSISNASQMNLVDKSWDDEINTLTGFELVSRGESDKSQEITTFKVDKPILSKISSLTTIHSGYRSPTVQNIVASVYIGIDIDLRQVAISTRNAEYNPKKVNALIFRLLKPKCTSLMFQTGRIMITGAKTIEDAKIGAKRIVKLLLKVLKSENIRFKNFKIENIIATADCCLPVRLESLARDYREFCSYEPELFAGLVYRCPPTRNTKAVLLVFVSGKIIITGCKSMREVHRVFTYMYPILRQYQV